MKDNIEAFVMLNLFAGLPIVLAIVSAKLILG
jgi:hypothetical protein